MAHDAEATSEAAVQILLKTKSVESLKPQCSTSLVLTPQGRATPVVGFYIVLACLFFF